MDKTEKRDPGLEYLDTTPVAVPVRFRHVGEGDRMKTLIHSLIRDMRDRDDVETFEESLDFEVDEDDDPVSSRVSLGEQRFMKEEHLLTEFKEAETIRERRRAAYEWRKRNEREAERQRSGDGEKGSGDGGEESGSKRGAGRRERGNARRGSAGTDGDSSVASKDRDGASAGKAGVAGED